MVINTAAGVIRLEDHESTDSEVLFQISNEEYASIKFELNSWIPFDAGDYVMLFGNRYTLMDKPAPIAVNGTNRYSYTLKFESPRAFLDKVNFELFDDTTLLTIDVYGPKTIYCKGAVVKSNAGNVYVFNYDTPEIGKDITETTYWSPIPAWIAGSYVTGNYVYVLNVVYQCLQDTNSTPKEGSYWTVVNTAPTFDFSTVLSPRDYADLICKNMNRSRPNQHWVVGDCISANPLSQAFSNASCLGALTTVCNLFSTEHWVDLDGDNFRLNINKLALITDPKISLSQGQNNGLLSITKQATTNSKRITRLVALGSTSNLYGTYRNGSNRLMLPNRYYLDAPAPYIDLANPLEGVQTWDDIMPNLQHATVDYNNDTQYEIGSQTLGLDGKSWDCISPCKGIIPVEGDNWKLSEGTITTFITESLNNVFVDKNLSFNPLASQYIMADGTQPKVCFITGDMAGYQFPITYSIAEEGGGYRLTIGQIQDSVGSYIPTVSYGFKQYDQYVLVDLYPPQSYVNKAEQRLLAAAEIYLAQYCIDQNTYDCPIDPVWSNINKIGFKIGQIVHIYNAELGVDDDYRIISLTRNITLPYNQKITLSNLPYIPSTYAQLKNDVANNTTYLQLSNINSPMFKVKTFRGAQEALEMAFDPDGDFYNKSIQPLSIQTAAVLVGTRTQQFSVSGIKFSSPIGTPNTISWTEGSITDSLMQTGDRTWSVVGSSFTVTDGDAAIYYCYLRCPVNVALTSGDIIFTQNQYKTKGTDGYYWFLVGTLGSVYNNRREFYTSYGFSFINGNNITTGKVQSRNGSTYFDLDNNEIAGRIIFRDGVVSGYVSIVNEEGDERAWLNGASTPEDDIILGIGGTKEANNPPFKVLEDGSIHAANGKFKALADGSIDMEFRKTVSDGDITITINSSTGIISTRKEGFVNSVSEMSVDGIIVNGGNTQAIPSSSGVELKASIVGLGFGNVASDFSGLAALCGVYGSASNSNATPAPSYGGYFQKLKANGLYLSVKAITANYTCTEYDNLISCYNTGTIVVTLPGTPYLGQVIEIRRNNAAIVNVQKADAHQILQDTPIDWTTIGSRGDLVHLTFDGSYWIWNAINI